MGFLPSCLTLRTEKSTRDILQGQPANVCSHRGFAVVGVQSGHPPLPVLGSKGESLITVPEKKHNKRTLGGWKGYRMGPLAFVSSNTLCPPSLALHTQRPTTSVSAMDCFHPASELQTSERQSVGQGALGAETLNQPSETDYYSETGHCPVYTSVHTQ